MLRQFLPHDTFLMEFLFFQVQLFVKFLNVASQLGFNDMVLCNLPLQLSVFHQQVAFGRIHFQLGVEEFLVTSQMLDIVLFLRQLVIQILATQTPRRTQIYLRRYARTLFVFFMVLVLRGSEVRSYLMHTDNDKLFVLIFIQIKQFFNDRTPIFNLDELGPPTPWVLVTLSLKLTAHLPLAIYRNHQVFSLHLPCSLGHLLSCNLFSHPNRSISIAFYRNTYC